MLMGTYRHSGCIPKRQRLERRTECVLPWAAAKRERNDSATNPIHWTDSNLSCPISSAFNKVRIAALRDESLDAEASDPKSAYRTRISSTSEERGANLMLIETDPRFALSNLLVPSLSKLAICHFLEDPIPGACPPKKWSSQSARTGSASIFPKEH